MPVLTAAEFACMPALGPPCELVQGRSVQQVIPTPHHGYICGNAAFALYRQVQNRDSGRVMTNGSAVVTKRDPDTVRGADVSYYSYDRLPRGPLPAGYLDVVPELIFEVRSPTDRWSAIHVKVGDYLRAGVTTVCVLDQQTETAHLYHQNAEPQKLTAEQDLTFPDILPGFSVKVGQLFA